MLTNGKLPVIESHALTMEERLEEEMFLGLRLSEGVDLAVISDKYGQNVEVLYQVAINQLIEKGYLMREDHRISLTRQGLLMANDVFEQFLLSI